LSFSQTAFSESADSKQNLQLQAKPASALKWLSLYTMVGATAAFLLSMMEWIDLQIQLTPVLLPSKNELFLRHTSA
jgi:hypothetical protein